EQRLEVAWFVAVIFCHLAHDLVLPSVLSEIPEAQIAVSELKCLCNVLNTNAKLGSLEPVYLDKQFRFVKFQIYINTLERRVVVGRLQEFRQYLADLFKVVIL